MFKKIIDWHNDWCVCYVIIKKYLFGSSPFNKLYNFYSHSFDTKYMNFRHYQKTKIKILSIKCFVSERRYWYVGQGENSDELYR